MTEAIRAHGLASDPDSFGWLEWHLGADEEDTGVYAQIEETPGNDDPCIGSMSTRALAYEVVNAHNASLLHVQQPDFGGRS
jgi:hypothetical protein